MYWSLSLLFFNTSNFLGSGSKGSIFCRTHGWIYWSPSVHPYLHPPPGCSNRKPVPLGAWSALSCFNSVPLAFNLFLMPELPPWYYQLDSIKVRISVHAHLTRTFTQYSPTHTLTLSHTYSFLTFCRGQSWVSGSWNKGRKTWNRVDVS